MWYFGYSRYPVKVRIRSISCLASSAFASPSGSARRRASSSRSFSSASLPALLEAPLAGARLEVPDVAEDHGHERGGAFAPARPGDVDLADAAHAVLVEVGLDGVPALAPACERGQFVEEVLVVLDVLRNATTSGCGRITSATSSSASPISAVTLPGTDWVSVSTAFFSPSHASSCSLSHQAACIAAMITWWLCGSNRIRFSSWRSARMKSSSAGPDFARDVALQRGDGGLAALDQLGDDGRIGLDRGGRGRRPAAAPRRPSSGQGRDEVAAIEHGLQRVADQRIGSAQRLQRGRRGSRASPASG